MREDLKLIPNHLGVTCRLSEILIQVDKEYNLTANYPKGHGDDFHDWLCRYHPLLRRLPTVRVCGGNCQDSDFEGSLPVYDSLDEMLAFTNECLKCSANALQHCLFITLSSMEVIAKLRVASILFLSVIVPMRWLAGNTHKLAHRNWGERSMGCAIDLLHSAFVKIQSDGALLLDYDFVMKIFCPIYSDLPEFEEYISYYFENKEGNIVGSVQSKDRVLSIDEAMAELFWPSKIRNRETSVFCKELAVGVATTLLTELEDTKKATHQYLSAVLGKHSQAVITEEEKLATVGVRANNDPSEGGFATLTDILQCSGRISLQSAAGIGQIRYNGDMSRRRKFLVTGRRSKLVHDNDDDDGLFHQLPEELTDSLLSMAKKHSARARKDFQVGLEMQRAARIEKMKVFESAKLKSAVDQHVDALYLHQQFFSPACWRSIEVAEQQFSKLTTKKEKLKNIKDQILMHYLSLGWEEAHHPWSFKGHAFPAEELFDHLISVVIPLEGLTHIPPVDLSVNLPK